MESERRADGVLDLPDPHPKRGPRIVALRVTLEFMERHQLPGASVPRCCQLPQYLELHALNIVHRTPFCVDHDGHGLDAQVDCDAPPDGDALRSDSDEAPQPQHNLLRAG